LASPGCGLAWTDTRPIAGLIVPSPGIDQMMPEGAYGLKLASGLDSSNHTLLPAQLGL